LLQIFGGDDVVSIFCVEGYGRWTQQQGKSRRSGGQKNDVWLESFFFVPYLLGIDWIEIPGWSNSPLSHRFSFIDREDAVFHVQVERECSGRKSCFGLLPVTQYMQGWWIAMSYISTCLLF